MGGCRERGRDEERACELYPGGLTSFIVVVCKQIRHSYRRGVMAFRDTSLM